MSEHRPGGGEVADAHLDLDALADLLAAEGTEAQVDHVARCAGCAARLAELDEAQAPVAAALAALPAPPLPDGLAERLSAAFAEAEPLPALEPTDDPGRPTALPPPDDREELDRAAEPVSGGGSRTVTPLQRDGRSRRTWLPAAAVAVLVLSAGGLALSTSPLGGGDDSDTAATTAEGGAEGGAGAGALPESAVTALATSESGRDYAAPGVVEQVLPEVLRGDAGPAPAAAAPVPAPDEQQSDAATSSEMRASGAELDRLREPAALQDCLRALLPADGSVQPLALDYASYAGQPALAVVLESGDPAKVDVFVVGADCAPGKDSTLFFTRVDRP